MNRRKLLFGSAAILAAIAKPAWSQALLNGGGKITENASGAAVTRPAAPVLPSSGVAIAFSLTNPAGQPTQTSPYFSFGFPFARGDFFDTTQKLSVYDATGTVKITDCQIDQISRGWKPDGSVNYCVVSGHLTGITLAAGATANLTMRAVTGAAPTTPVCTLATLTAQSDIKAVCVIGSDTFTISFNTIAAATPALTNPQTYLRQWKAGPTSCEWCFGGYLKRNSDGAYHRWAFLRLYVTALSASGPFVVRGYAENPNTYGPNPNGTIGTVPGYVPLQVLDSIDIYNGSTHICALGGINDLNNGAFAPSAVNLTTGEINATFAGGTLNGSALGSARTPIGFVSTGTLPTGLASAATTTYWAVPDGANGQQIIPTLSRFYATGLVEGIYKRIANPVAGTSVAVNKFIQVNGGTYLSTKAGVSTGRLPTGTTFADNSAGGALVWTLISAQITGQGSGAHTMVMKAAAWSGSKAPIVGPDTHPFWSGAGSLPKLLPGYDRSYLFAKTKTMPPLDPAIAPAAWVGGVPRYVQNMMYLPGAPDVYYIGNVGENAVDERINMTSPTAMASACLPADVGMATSCRLMALSWTDRNSLWRDERSQEIYVVNYGPDRLGATYPGMAPSNPTLVMAASNSTPGSPPQLRYNGEFSGYGGSFLGGGVNAPDSAHTSNTFYWPALVSGDPLFFDPMMELAAFQLGTNHGGQAFRSALINGKNMTWAWPFMVQTRTAGHAFGIFAQVEWITPDFHPAKPYFSDVMDDSSTIGTLWSAANVGPNGKSVGYIPMIYPAGAATWQPQAQETWMQSYLQFGHLLEILKGNRPGFKTFLETYLYKALLPLWDSDVGGSEQFIDMQWDMIANVNNGPDPPLDSQFLLTVPDRLAGNPVQFLAFEVIPPAQKLFINGTPSDQSKTAGSYTYRNPGSIGTFGSGFNAAFPGNAYGLTARAVCEMGAMAGLAYHTKLANRIQAFADLYYPDSRTGKGNFCNWTTQTGTGNTNGLMYAMKRQ